MKRKRLRGKLLIVDGHLHQGQAVSMKVSPRQHLDLLIHEQCYAFDAMKERWSSKLPFYVSRCNQHKVFYLDYPNRTDDHLNCPTCLKVFLKQADDYFLKMGTHDLGNSIIAETLMGVRKDDFGYSTF
jgi:hypothetical protein